MAVTLAPLGRENSPLTVDDFFRLQSERRLPEKGVELINGRVILKVGQNAKHYKSVKLALQALDAVTPGDLFTGTQGTIRLSPVDGPEPDVFVARGDERDLDREVTVADVALVLEVGVTSLRDDRTEKAAMYARAAIPEYWLVNPVGRQVEVRRVPKDGEYAELTILTEDDALAPLFAPERPIAARDLLGRMGHSAD